MSLRDCGRMPTIHGSLPQRLISWMHSSTASSATSGGRTWVSVSKILKPFFMRGSPHDINYFGVMECWSNGVMLIIPKTPVLQYSITPLSLRRVGFKKVFYPCHRRRNELRRMAPFGDDFRIRRQRRNLVADHPRVIEIVARHDHHRCPAILDELSCNTEHKIAAEHAFAERCYFFRLKFRPLLGKFFGPSAVEIFGDNAAVLVRDADRLLDHCSDHTLRRSLY